MHTLNTHVEVSLHMVLLNYCGSLSALRTVQERGQRRPTDHPPHLSLSLHVCSFPGLGCPLTPGIILPYLVPSPCLHPALYHILSNPTKW